MTTIAYRNGVLAADTAAHIGNSFYATVKKICRRSDGDMAAASGEASYNAEFCKWFMGGEAGDPPKAGESERYLDRGAIFRQSGEIEIFEPGGRFVITAPYAAFGCGMDFALGAMFAGADAETAVRAAIQHDPYTAGNVVVLRAKDEDYALVAA